MKNALRLSVPVLFSILAFGASAPSAFAASWDVNNTLYLDNATCVSAQQCNTIQAAVTAAASGDTINVAAGTYTEQINVGDQYHLTTHLIFKGSNTGISAGSVPVTRNSETIINGGFRLWGGSSVIDGFTITGGFIMSGAAHSGIVVGSANGGSPNVTIENNIIKDCVGNQSNGIEVVAGSTSLQILNNEVVNNWRGLYINNTSGITISGNKIHANNGVGVGIGSSGLSNFTLTNNIIADQNLEGWGTDNVGAIVVAHDNQFTNNLVSIAWYAGTSNKIDATNNWWGSATLLTVQGQVNDTAKVMVAPYYVDEAKTTLSDLKTITAFNFAVPAATGVVSGTDIAVSVPAGTDVTALVPTITTGASASPVSGVAHNFSSSATYTVTAIDGTTQDYIVTVTVAAPTVVYVDSLKSDDTGNGLTLGTAKKTILSAIALVATGGTIHVAAGTYSVSNANINKSLIFLGAQAGVDARGGRPGASETIISGSGFGTFTLAASDITFDGFTFSDLKSRELDSTVNADNFTMRNSILQGNIAPVGPNQYLTGAIQFGGPNSGAGAVHANGFLFEQNLVTADNGNLLYFGHAMDNGTIRNNEFHGDTVAFGPFGVRTGWVIEGNDFNGDVAGHDPYWGFAFNANLGNATIQNNTFTKMNLGLGQVSIVGGSITGNTFNDNKSAAFQLWGGEWNSVVSGNVQIENNTISYNGMACTGFGDASHGIRLRTNDVPANGIDTSTIHIQNNTFTDLGVGTCGQAWAIRNNGNPATSADAIKNWWGSAVESAILSKISGNVSYKPWYTDSGRATLRYATMIDENGNPTITPNPVTITATEDGNVGIVIPSNMTITGPAGWTGDLILPTVTTTTVTVPSFDTFVTSAITVGSNLFDLTFDKAVKLTFADQKDKLIGWYNHANVFTEITATCSGDNDETSQTTSLGAGASCKMNVDNDLVVWTKHFSTFTTYTQTPVAVTPPSSHGGGGGEVGCTTGTAYNPSTSSCVRVGATPATPAVPGVNPAVPATPSINSNGNANGRVLGAATFNFTRDLGVGLSGADVTELQQILIDAGILKIDAPTGNFGQLTKAAVQAFQKAHGVSQTGYVGPLTRGELNKGVTPTATNLTSVQADAILSLLESFGADASVVARVRASLGR